MELLLMPVNIKIQGKVRDAIVEICRIEAEKIMGGLIEKHPAWTGKMFRASTRGSTTTMEFGFENNEEANVLENGAEAASFTGTFVQNVPEHKRELGKPPKGRTRKVARRITRKRPRNITVEKHTRTYKDMKPVRLSSGEWRILRGTPAQKGQAPLYTGITKILKDEKVLGKRLKQLLE